MQKGNAYQCSETENDGMQMRQLRNAETAVPYPKGGWLFFCFRTVPSLLRNAEIIVSQTDSRVAASSSVQLSIKVRS